MKNDMMTRKCLVVLLALSAIMMCSCHNNTKHHNSQPISSVKLKYAKGFSIDNFAEYQRIDIYTPWNTDKQIQQRYYLVSSDSIEVPGDGIKLRIPIESWATASCTHIGFLCAIDEMEHIAGVTNPDIIYNDTVRQLYAQGAITDIGDALSINTEVVMSLHPDVLILNLIGSNDTQASHLKNAGVTLLYNNEWKESTPLARAEWIKLFGVLCCKSAKSDSLFSAIEQHYNSLRDRARHTNAPHPNIVSGGDFRGTWYVPSAKTYMGYMFADAGANYYFANDSTTESIPLTMEKALMCFSDADIWVGAPANSYEELLAQDSKYGMMKAVKNKKVYNFYARSRQGGANDFWESGVVRPDLLLQDLLIMLYGDSIGQGAQLTYSKPLL